MNAEAVVEGDYEYVPVRLPPNTGRLSTAVQLALQAEFGGWELARLRLMQDGTRRVVLRRKRSKRLLPGPTL
ncbi:MAG: DUF5703 family protein [Mycobacteriales bacterium]